MLIVGVVDAAFDEHASGANRLGIFRGQGTLLRAGWPRQRKCNKSKTHESKSAHERSFCGGAKKPPLKTFFSRGISAFGGAPPKVFFFSRRGVTGAPFRNESVAFPRKSPGAPR